MRFLRIFLFIILVNWVIPRERKLITESAKCQPDGSRLELSSFILLFILFKLKSAFKVHPLQTFVVFSLVLLNKLPVQKIGLPPVSIQPIHELTIQVSHDAKLHKLFECQGNTFLVKFHCILNQRHQSLKQLFERHFKQAAISDSNKAEFSNQCDQVKRHFF